MHLLCSFPSNVTGIVGAGIHRSCNSQEVVSLQHLTIAEKQPQAKLIGSQLPLRRLKLPCGICTNNSIQRCRHICVHSTSLTCRKKKGKN